MVQMGQKGQNGDHGTERGQEQGQNGGQMKKVREIVARHVKRKGVKTDQ